MITSEQWLEKGGSVGPAMENMEILVVGDDGSALGPNKLAHSISETSRERISSITTHRTNRGSHREPGVFTTGDVGHLDDDGYLWLSDRKIDMIISGGVNIYPAEIEGVLGGHDLVADVAVIGVPDDEFGEAVKAIVVAKNGVEINDELRSTLDVLCGQNLAGYKRPRTYDFVAELPRTGTGKILKRKLREPYWERHERKI